MTFETRLYVIDKITLIAEDYRRRIRRAPIWLRVLIPAYDHRIDEYGVYARVLEEAVVELRRTW